MPLNNTSVTVVSALVSRDMRCPVVRIMKLVGMSRASSGSFRDLGFCGLGGVSGRDDVAVAGVVDAMVFGHDREETLGVAGSRS